MWLKNFIKLFLNSKIKLSGFVKIDNDVELLLGRNASLVLGKHVQIRKNTVIAVYNNAALEIADKVFVAHGVTIAAKKNVYIGADSLIAEYVSIRDHDHDYKKSDIELVKRGDVIEPVQIGSNVWIGAKATILKGVTIGKEVVIGANSVVTKDLPAGVIAAGIPAGVLKKKK